MLICTAFPYSMYAIFGSIANKVFEPKLNFRIRNGGVTNGIL
jgi:hypothetical protein